ncbi:MAG: AAA family ATPase [Alphaproteobacteria bacterium]
MPRATANRAMPSPVVEDQSETIAMLADPASHGGAEVERIETHASIVVLAGDCAYKLKRAVHFPFLDYGTVARRKRACRDEVALNRRTAPTLYRGVAPIVRRGKLRLGALGEDPADAVDWVVVMCRFDQATLFDRLAEGGRLTRDLVERAANAVARFHGAAERRFGADGTSTLAWVIDDNVAELGDEALLAGKVDRLARLCRAALERNRALLDARSRAGFVRVCHGDLHLRNLCMIDGEPTAFDAIEFNERLTVIDVFYDLAFLLMDLEHRSLRDLANAALNRWLDATDDVEGLALLPLFLGLRAAVRAKVGAVSARLTGKPSTEPAAYLDLALGFLEPAAPVLVAIGGLSGTGKSTLARALAPAIGPAPGALLTRSDVVRKRLFGVAETEPLPHAAYAAEATTRVYGVVRARTDRAIRAGHGAIADAVHARPEERAAIEAVARDAGARFIGLWLEAPEPTLIERVETRRGDASDAGAGVVRAQLAYDVGAIGWHRLDANVEPERTLALALVAAGA